MEPVFVVTMASDAEVTQLMCHDLTLSFSYDPREQIESNAAKILPCRGRP